MARREKPQLDLFGGGRAAAEADPAAEAESAPKRRRPAKAPQAEAPSARAATGRAVAAMLAGPAAAPADPPAKSAAPRGEPPAPVGAEPPAGRSAAVRDAIRARLAGEAPAPAAPRVLTVRELAGRIKGSLEQQFGAVHVRGEISNLRQPGSGHLYFSLKDDAACIRAVMFRSQARLLRFRAENGQEVIARGRVSFYDAAGDAQLVCEGLEPVGAGALALAFEQLKTRLAAEGLFEAARKRPVPFLPRRIGVVTSPTGAAIRDFLRVLHRRFPGLPVLVAPARVQGEGAAAEVAAGIRRLSERGDCDVIVVTRGGGSIEDLWAFNEEVVARAIAASAVPVVSAVGHEVDFTIADFVADRRAPTPTAAAELLAPVEGELRAGLAVARTRLSRALLGGLERRRLVVQRRLGALGDPRRRVADGRLALDGARRRAGAAMRRARAADAQRLRALQARLRQAHPAAQLKARERALAALGARLQAAMRRQLEARAGGLGRLDQALHRRSPRERVLREGRRLGESLGRLHALAAREQERRRARLAELRQRLSALSPLRVLARGYSVAFRESGVVLLSAAEARAGERLHLELADGALAVDVVGRAPERKAALPHEAPGPIDPDGSGR